MANPNWDQMVDPLGGLLAAGCEQPGAFIGAEHAPGVTTARRQGEISARRDEAADFAERLDARLSGGAKPAPAANATGKTGIERIKAEVAAKYANQPPAVVQAVLDGLMQVALDNGTLNNGAADAAADEAADEIDYDWGD